MNRTLIPLMLLLAGAAATPVHAQSVLAMPPSPEVPGAGWTRSDVRRYYPEERRVRERHRRQPILGWFDVRGGFYDAQDVSANDWTIGIKVAGRVAPNIQAGIATDLHRRTESGRTVTSQYVDATGHTVTTTNTLFEAESNLWPIMGVLEVHMPSAGVDPYVGAAGGWEFLNVRVRDAVTGYDSDANYDGPGYQLYGGLGLPINPRARFTVEGYWNGSTVEREIFDYQTGFLVKERIEVDGGGVRGGLSFAF